MEGARKKQRQKAAGMICSVDGCGWPVDCCGLCAAHWQRRKLGISFDTPVRRKVRGLVVCKIGECGRKVKSNGLCAAHDKRRRDGSFLDSPINSVRKRGDPPEIKTSSVPCEIAGLIGDCWVYSGWKNDSGYGIVVIGRKNGKRVRARVHRYVWERDVGAIPPGMVIDHVCRNRACCNVDHLKVVDRSENVLENSLSPSAINKKKTHCNRGHEFTDENTYSYRPTSRQCKACMSERASRYRSERKLKETSQWPDKIRCS